MMFNQLNKLNMVDAAELKAYIDRIVSDMDKAQLAAMEKAPLGYGAKIRANIEASWNLIIEKTLKGGWKRNVSSV